MRHAIVLTILLVACSSGAPPERVLSKTEIADPDRTTVRAPAFATDLEFLDVHMHCGDARSKQDACLLSQEWASIEGDRGAGVIASLEHWTLNMTPEVLAKFEQLEPKHAPFDKNNELYLRTAQAWGHVEFFASLECWHDTALGPGWADACKEDARAWVREGAIGFKDHIGRNADLEEDPVVSNAGVFSGGWSRKAGLCPAQMSNKECMKQPEIAYPALREEWRSVLQYLVEDLQAPVLTHATTFSKSPGECWDPLLQALSPCPEMSRRHALDLARWAQTHIDPRARRRIIMAHTGFMVPGAQIEEPEAEEMLGQLRALLETGVSVDTAAIKDWAALVERDPCALRTLVAQFPDQFVFGTDLNVDRRACIQDTYRFWEDLLTGALDQTGPQRTTCVGEARTRGLALGQETVPGCDARVPSGTLARVLRGNFEAMYESR